eukprot:4189326-Karenia_brevis.AAC.1
MGKQAVITIQYFPSRGISCFFSDLLVLDKSSSRACNLIQAGSLLKQAQVSSRPWVVKDLPSNG